MAVTTADLPQFARVVVIGGGVGGTSVALHLAEMGERDVLLVERSELTSGSTFHSAGLVGQLRADPTLTRMNMYSVELHRRLAGVRRNQARVVAGTPRRDPSPDQLGAQFRPAVARDLAGRGGRPLPVGGPRRRGRSRLPRIRRTPGSGAVVLHARYGCACPGCPGSTAHARHRDIDTSWAR